MKPFFKRKFISDPVYKAHFWMCYGEHDKFARFVKSKSVDKEVHNLQQNNANGKVVKCDDNIFFVWVESADLTVLAHELIHYMACTLGTRGLELNPTTEEAFAYYFEFLFEECRNVLKKRPTKKKTGGKNDKRSQTNNTRESSPK